jgi:PIN domain nuclease of toxin-antitoxin system
LGRRPAKRRSPHPKAPLRLLLDTHALVWWLVDSPALSADARAAIADPANEVWASAVAGYELANKQRLGKLQPPVADELTSMVRRAGLPVLPISLNHAVAAGALPGPHRDPWDRLLMAQARTDGLRIVTCDPVFADYAVPTLW